MGHFRCAAGLVMLLFAGCAAPLNVSTGLVGEDLAALSPYEPGLAGHDEPSLDGLDRRHWDLVRVRVPTGQVEHYPTYVQFLQVGPSGDYPTVTSALETNVQRGHDALDTICQPALAALYCVWWPVELASGNGPWKAQHSERFAFDREDSDRPDPPWTWVASDESPAP